MDAEILEHADTDIGTIYLDRRKVAGQTDFVYEIQISGALLMSSLAPVSEMELSTRAIAMHSGTAPLRVLVGGLGLGHTAQAALAQPQVASVRVVEKMDFIIEWMSRGLFPLSAELAAEERLTIARGDIYDDLLGPAHDTYDLILVDVDHSPHSPLSIASDPFYTVEGQMAVSAHLNPNGILGVWSADPSDEFLDVLRAVYLDAHAQDVRWPNIEDPQLPFHNVLFFGRRSDQPPAP